MNISDRKKRQIDLIASKNFIMLVTAIKNESMDVVQALTDVIIELSIVAMESDKIFPLDVVENMTFFDMQEAFMVKKSEDTSAIINDIQKRQLEMLELIKGMKCVKPEKKLPSAFFD